MLNEKIYRFEYLAHWIEVKLEETETDIRCGATTNIAYAHASYEEENIRYGMLEGIKDLLVTMAMEHVDLNEPRLHEAIESYLADLIQHW